MRGLGETHHSMMGFTRQSYGLRAHTFNLPLHNLQFLVTYCLSILMLHLSMVVAEERVLEYYVWEETGPDTKVADLIGGLGLDKKYSSDKVNLLRFKFLTRPSQDKDFFYIDEISGFIKTKFQIDRDQVCPNQELCLANYDVVIQPRAFFEIVKVQIEIKDVNDNEPRFPQRKITHQISESAATTTNFVIPPAIDPDSPRYGIKHYGLFPESKKFAIEKRETADGATDLRLVLIGKLDREKNDFYELTVVAYDGGDPRKSGSISVDVHVMDANDNDPQFDNETYRETVKENTPLGTTIIRVTAHDADEGSNGKIEYELSSSTEDCELLFDINPDTGEVYVKGDLDYEKRQMCLLALTARDLGPDSLPASATLLVYIQDVNDNAPEISDTIMTTDGTTTVKENAAVETFVTLISVSDKDSGQNGRFSCNIDNSDFSLVSVSDNHYKLVTATVFDREVQSEYEVTLTCRDHGFPARVTATAILVSIQDENDHAPMFTSKSYTSHIQENNNIREVIMTVSATDFDSGPNGEVTYSLNEEARQYLHIDPYTGVIIANIIFDHEQIKDLQFIITAQDGGNPSRSKSIGAHLTIQDFNDERPKFLQDNYSFEVSENMPPNTLVGNVTATDGDSEPFNTFSYHIHPNSGPALRRFKIDPALGKLYTTIELDRESQEFYYLIVMAKPQNDPHFTSTATVTVRVKDVNDHYPEFHYPTQVNNTILVSSHTPRDHVVSRLRAVDQDIGENGKLSYFIISGNKGNTFKINEENGAISVNADLSVINRQEFELGVKVADNGHPQYVDTGSLRITVRGDIQFYVDPNGSLLSEENLTIILVFALATVCVAIVIIIAIVVIVRKKSRTSDSHAEKEKQRMLCNKNNGSADGQQGAGLTKLATPNTYTSVHDELDRTRSPTQNHQGPGDTKPKANGYLKVDLRMEGLAKQQQQQKQQSPNREADLPPPPSSWMTSPVSSFGGPRHTSGSVHSASSGDTLLRPSSRDGSASGAGHVLCDERHSPLDKQMSPIQQAPKPVVAFIRDQAETEPTESDSAGSGLSNSDSGRGHSSEDGEGGLHRSGHGGHHPAHPVHPSHHLSHQGLDELSALHPDLSVKHPRTDCARRTRSPVLRHTTSPPSQLPANGGPPHRIAMSPSCHLPANTGPHRDMLMRELCDTMNKSPKPERVHYDSRSLDRSGKKTPHVRFATSRRGDNTSTLPGNRLYGQDDFDLPLHTERMSGSSGDYFMYDSVDSAV